jgi:hypothetical protein
VGLDFLRFCLGGFRKELEGVFVLLIIAGKNALAYKLVVEIGEIEGELVFHSFQVFLGILVHFQRHVAVRPG